MRSNAPYGTYSTLHTALSYRFILKNKARGFGNMLQSRSFSAQKGSTSKVLPTF